MPGSASVIDVARRAGVSVGTVSNVLNRPQSVAPGTRVRVQAAIEELGFIRNEAARQLRVGRSRTIGLVVLDVGNPFFTDLAVGVESAAADSGLSVILCNSAQSATREEHYLKLLQAQRSYGVLVTPVSARRGQIDEIRRSGTPAVLVDTGSSRRRCSVSVNDTVGGELAVSHLLTMGHERIAFAGGPMGLRQVSDRLQGARQAALTGSPRCRIEVVETPLLNVAEGRQAGARIAAMTAKTRPTAVFCANDLLALGLLQEMTRRGIRVPDDLAIVGYDDIVFAAAAAVPLTSVHQPSSQLGGAATQLLIDEVANAGDHRHRQVVFEPELIVRQSTDPTTVDTGRDDPGPG